MPKPTVKSLQRKLKSSQDQLKLLQRITSSISYTLDIDDVLHEIVDVVADTMRANSCLIYLADADRKHLILKASKIPHPKAINTIVMNIGEGITGWAAEHRKTVAIEQNAFEDRRFLTVPQLAEDAWQGIISAPILFQNQLVGVINVQYKRKRKHSKEHIKLLETIAAQVGGALYNAKLLSETQALKEALETRKIIEQAKGLLMLRDNLTEQQAYSAMRSKAMNTKRSMKQIAEAVVLTLG